MLLREVSRALGRLGCEGQPLLVAVSGGIDSVSLLCALHELAQENQLKLSIGHVNHGLRGDASEADQAWVEALGQRLGLPVESARIDPESARGGLPSRDRPTLQEASRSLRYEALEDLAERLGASQIATAHNADDQAETVLLRLLRGTGPDGLGGIPERGRGGRVVRPLLAVGRAEIERFARERRLEWREDASNAELGYARNRLRRRWIPGLAEDFNPRLLRAIGELAEAQRRDSEWIDTRVKQESAVRLTVETVETVDRAGTVDARRGEAWLCIDAKDWDALPPALARRLARTALQRCGAARLVSRVHLERMTGFLGSGRSGTAIELPGGLTLRRDRGGFRLGPLPASDARDPC